MPPLYPSGRSSTLSHRGSKPPDASPTERQVSAKNDGVPLEGRADNPPSERPGRPGRDSRRAPYLFRPRLPVARVRHRRPRSLPGRRPPLSRRRVPLSGSRSAPASPPSGASGVSIRRRARTSRNLPGPNSDLVRGTSPSEDFDDSSARLQPCFDGNRLEKRCEDTRN